MVEIRFKSDLKFPWPSWKTAGYLPGTWSHYVFIHLFGSVVSLTYEPWLPISTKMPCHCEQTDMSTMKICKFAVDWHIHAFPKLGFNRYFFKNSIFCTIGLYYIAGSIIDNVTFSFGFSAISLANYSLII